jgi:hypothetical protein
MSSKSQNVATQTVLPATKSKGTLFGLSREQLKIVNGGGGVIIMNPIDSPFPTVVTETPALATPISEVPAVFPATTLITP